LVDEVLVGVGGPLRGGDGVDPLLEVQPGDGAGRLLGLGPRLAHGLPPLLQFLVGQPRGPLALVQRAQVRAAQVAEVAGDLVGVPGVPGAEGRVVPRPEVAEPWPAENAELPDLAERPHGPERAGRAARPERPKLAQRAEPAELAGHGPRLSARAGLAPGRL